MLEGLDQYVETAMLEFKEQLTRLVSIPSISQKLNPDSPEPEHTADLLRVAQQVAQLTDSYGFQTTVLQSDVHTPGIVATLNVNPNVPWVLIYNHLDVQPANEPEWRTTPFEPVVSDEYIIGRGATDDKGPMLATLYAIRFLHKSSQLPVNVALLFETNEENGSVGFPALLKSARDKGLFPDPDSILVSDTIFEGDNPTITYSLRGLVRAKVSLNTANQNVHSGLGGGVIANPLNQLVYALAQCQDPKTGILRIPHIYERTDLTKREADELQRVADISDVDKLVRDLGARETYLHSGTLEALTRLWRKPTFEVHMINGGVKGTKIPYAVDAEVTLRLVGKQDPERVLGYLRDFLTGINPNLKVTGSGTPAVEVLLDNPFIGKATAACEAGFGRKPLYVGSGGTIGSMPPLQQAFPSAPIVFLAMSKASDGYHAPNERFEWAQAAAGIKTMAHYIDSLGK